MRLNFNFLLNYAGDFYNGRFKKLNLKERRLSVLLLSAFLVSLYFTLFLKPNFKQIAALKEEDAQAAKRIQLLTAQFTQPAKTKNELVLFKEEINAIKLRTKEVENKLLGIEQVPQILNELIKCAQGLKIEFQSVKQNIEPGPGKEIFSHLNIDLKFESRYEEMLGYLCRIEKVSPFMKVEEVYLSQSKADPRNLVTSAIRLSALLSNAQKQQGELSAAAANLEVRPALKTAKSPFIPAIKIGQVKAKALKLSGITCRSLQQDSTAIINDTVVRKGDEIQGYKVQSISQNEVVLSDGEEEYKLNMER